MEKRKAGVSEAGQTEADADPSHWIPRRWDLMLLVLLVLPVP